MGNNSSTNDSNVSNESDGPTGQERLDLATQIVANLAETGLEISLEDALFCIDEYHLARSNAQPADEDFPLTAVLGLTNPKRFLPKAE